MLPNDAGIVAVTPSGEAVGAAWFREHVMDNAPGRAPHGTREVFVGVHEVWEGRGMATELLRLLIERAETERLATLIAYPLAERPEPAALCRSFGFEPTNGIWFVTLTREDATAAVGVNSKGPAGDAGTLCPSMVPARARLLKCLPNSRPSG